MFKRTLSLAIAGTMLLLSLTACGSAPAVSSSNASSAPESSAQSTPYEAPDIPPEVVTSDDRGIPGMKTTAIRYTLESDPFVIPANLSKPAPVEASEVYAASYTSRGVAANGISYDYSITVDKDDEIIGATFGLLNSANGSNSGLLIAADLFFYVVSLLDYDTAQREDLASWFETTLPSLKDSAEVTFGDAKFELYVMPGLSYWVDISKVST